MREAIPVNRLKREEILRRLEERLRRRSRRTTKNKDTGNVRQNYMHFKSEKETDRKVFNKKLCSTRVPVKLGHFSMSCLQTWKKEMSKEQEGGVVIGRRKIWTISYADEIVLMVNNAQGLKNMIKRFE